jgi:hypothetical protein
MDVQSWLGHLELSGTDGAFDIAHQLGLELTLTSRTVDVLVVRRIQ